MKTFRAFQRCRSGTAGMEFALVFPVMMLVYGGVVELNNYNNTNLKVAQVAYEIEDLVGRQTSLSTASAPAVGTSMSTICAMAYPVLYPASVAGLTMTIRDVTVTPTTLANVVSWKATASVASNVVSCTKAANDTYTLPSSITNSTGATTVSHLVVVVGYTYKPILTTSLLKYLGLNFATAMSSTFVGVPRYIVGVIPYS